MATSFTIEVKGLEKVRAIFKDLPNRVQQEVREEFRATGNQWAGEAKIDAPANVGRLRASISPSSDGLALEVVAQTTYAGYQEFGTKSQTRVPAELQGYAASLRGPGDNGGMTALQALQLWVQKKGLAATYSVKTKRRTKRKSEAALTKQIAFLIYQKIKRVGIRPHSYLFSSIAAPGSGDRMDKFINQLRTNIAAALQRIV